MSDRMEITIIITVLLVYLLGVGATQNFLGKEWGLVCHDAKDSMERPVRVCNDPSGDGANTASRIGVSLAWPVALPIIAGHRLTN